MNNFSWSKAFGFGVLIWAVMFILASILVAFGVSIGIGWSLVLAIVMAVLSYSFAVNANAGNSGQALGYGLLWAAIGIVLDLVISRQFQSNIFGMWTYWVGYALILFAPWVEYEVQGMGAHPKAV